MKTISLSKSKIDKEIFKIRRSQHEDFAEIEDLVSKIISKVKKNGDKALFLFTKKFDGILINSNNLRLNKFIIENSGNQLSSSLKSAIKISIKRVTDYQKKKLTKKYRYKRKYNIKKRKSKIKKRELILNQNEYKDFLDINTFSKIINLIIKKKIFGTYNISMGRKVYLKDINNWLLNSIKNKKKFKIIKLKNNEKNQSFYLNNSKLKKRIGLKINIKQLRKECIKLSKKLFK